VTEPVRATPPSDLYSLRQNFFASQLDMKGAGLLALS